MGSRPGSIATRWTVIVPGALARAADNSMGGELASAELSRAAVDCPVEPLLAGAEWPGTGPLRSRWASDGAPERAGVSAS